MAWTRSSGATGFGGVGTRCRSPMILPASSSSAALIPVPPISIASVRGSFMAGLSSSRKPLRLLRLQVRLEGIRVKLICRYTRPTQRIVADGMRITATVIKVAAIAVFGALFSSGSARAGGPPVPEDLVKAGLVAETASIAPGGSLWVDLHLEVKPGWHVYWQNPGDSGLPTAIDWKLPSGFSAGHIPWPVPEHFVQNGIGNYGYAGTVDLLVPIASPQELAVGQTAAFDAEASWLACADICSPGSVKLGLKLPDAAQPAGPDPAVAPLFAAARRHLPVPAPFETRFASDAEDFRLLVPASAIGELRNPTGLFFPTK